MGDDALDPHDEDDVSVTPCSWRTWAMSQRRSIVVMTAEGETEAGVIVSIFRIAVRADDC